MFTGIPGATVVVDTYSSFAVCLSLCTTTVLWLWIPSVAGVPYKWCKEKELIAHCGRVGVLNAEVRTRATLGFRHPPERCYARLGMIRSNSQFPRRADPPLAFTLFFGHRLRGGSISPAVVDAIAAGIQNQEGYYPGSVAYRNNNPGNLVFAGQPGASPGAGGFAQFATYDQGLAAAKNQITLDATRGTDVNGNPTGTLAQLLSSWAPPSENNTAAYISGVSGFTGFDPNASLSSLGASSPSVYVSDSGSPAGIDLESLAAASVDLSSVGLSSSVPWWWIGAGAVGLLILARR